MPVRNIPNELQALTILGTSGTPEECLGEFRKALADKVNVIVAKAAKLTAERQLRELIPELCAAFERLFVNPVKTDPKCWGKEAIAKALKDLEHAESTLFLMGIQHVQSEPVWGGQEDTATTLRGTCALALLQCTDLTRDEKLWHVMRLLTETSPSLRKDGAVAMESLGGREAALLLRIKARMGDSDGTVVGQVLESLLRVERESAVPFVVEFLRAGASEISEEAALALGASRLSAAVHALKDVCADKSILLDREVLFRALSISRHPEAIEFLVEAVRNRPETDALRALDALHLYRDSSEIRAQVAEALASRTDGELRQVFERVFTNVN